MAMLDRHVKLFCDGAIVSQLLRWPTYLDENGEPTPHHHGEWMMEQKISARLSIRTG